MCQPILTTSKGKNVQKNKEKRGEYVCEIKGKKHFVKNVSDPYGRDDCENKEYISVFEKPLYGSKFCELYSGFFVEVVSACFSFAALHHSYKSNNLAKDLYMICNDRIHGIIFRL